MLDFILLKLTTGQSFQLYAKLEMQGWVFWVGGGMRVALPIIDALPLFDTMIASEKSIFIAFCVPILLKEGGRQLLAVLEQGLPLTNPPECSRTHNRTEHKQKTVLHCQAFYRVNSVQEAKLHF